MSSKGVVVVGLGNAGKARVRDLKEANKWDETKHVKLIGYVSKRDLDIDGVQQMTFEEALGCFDVHIIIIATENKFHFEQAKNCIKAGKHVIVEFPLATNAEDVAELQRLAKNKGVVLHEENLSLMFESQKETRQYVQSKPALKEAAIDFIVTCNRWQSDVENSGSPFTSWIVHLHTIYDIFGEMTPVKASLKKDDTGLHAVGVVKTKDGKPITIIMKFTKEYSQRTTDFKFVFEDGSEYLGAQRKFPKRAGLFMLDFMQFLRKVEDGSPVEPSPEATLHCHQLADALFKLTEYSNAKE